MHIYREPPRIEDLAKSLAARIARDGQRDITETIPFVTTIHTGAA